MPQPWDAYSVPGIWRFKPYETQRLAWNLACAYYAASDRSLDDLMDFPRRRELKIALDLVESGVTPTEAQAFVAWTRAERFRPQATSLRVLENCLVDFRKPLARPSEHDHLAGMQRTAGSVFDLPEPE